MNMFNTLKCQNNIQIAYHQTPGKSPGVIYLSGFMSDMSGTKALYLEKVCQQLGHAFLRFDYQGHGQSSGRFEDGTIGLWKRDVLMVLDQLTEGPQILVGSSMGGWLMMLAALERPERIQALVGIASAPDFTEDLFEKLNPEEQTAMERDGICYVPSSFGENPYPFTKQLIDDGKQHHILDKPIPVHCPIRLIHGSNDTHVLWQQSLRLLEAVESKNTLLTIIKDGDHRLSSESDLNILGTTLKDLLNPLISPTV